jgi:hypothetical protein
MEKNTNNSDHYKISNKLPLIGISALTIIILGILFMNKPNLKYEVSAEENVRNISKQRRCCEASGIYAHILFERHIIQIYRPQACRSIFNKSFRRSCLISPCIDYWMMNSKTS